MSTISGTAGEHNACAMPLLPQATSNMQADADRTGVVGRGHLNREARISLRGILITEHAEGEDDEVNITGIEHTVDDVAVRRRVLRIEVHCFDSGDTEGSERLDRCMTRRVRTTSEKYAAKAVARQCLHGLEGQ